MSKQTAVDLFHDRVMELLRNAKSVNSNTVAIIWIECKAVEREQIEDAYDDGKKDGIYEAIDEGAVYDNKENYYHDTYGKEQK